MIESEVALKTADGTMSTFVVHPDRGGPFPVVVMFMDGLGMREAMRDVARRLATSGYYVVLPNLYYRDGVTEPLTLDAPDAMDRIMALVRKVTVERAMADATVGLAHAAGDPAARAGTIGVMGFCMGGRLAVAATSALGDKVAAAVSIHPGFLDEAMTQFEASDLDGIRASIYVGAADNDPTFGDEMRNRLGATLTAHKIDHEIELHKGAVHGYFVPPRHEKPTAERVWSRALVLLGRKL